MLRHSPLALQDGVGRSIIYLNGARNPLIYLVIKLTSAFNCMMHLSKRRTLREPLHQHQTVAKSTWVTIRQGSNALEFVGIAGHLSRIAKAAPLL